MGSPHLPLLHVIPVLSRSREGTGRGEVCAELLAFWPLEVAEEFSKHSFSIRLAPLGNKGLATGAVPALRQHPRPGREKHGH